MIEPANHDARSILATTSALQAWTLTTERDMLCDLIDMLVQDGRIHPMTLTVYLAFRADISMMAAVPIEDLDLKGNNAVTRNGALISFDNLCPP